MALLVFIDQHIVSIGEQKCQRVFTDELENQRDVMNEEKGQGVPLNYLERQKLSKVSEGPASRPNQDGGQEGFHRRVKGQNVFIDKLRCRRMSIVGQEVSIGELVGHHRQGGGPKSLARRAGEKKTLRR